MRKFGLINAADRVGQFVIPNALIMLSIYFHVEVPDILLDNTVVTTIHGYLRAGGL